MLVFIGIVMAPKTIPSMARKNGAFRTLLSLFRRLPLVESLFELAELLTARGVEPGGGL